MKHYDDVKARKRNVSATCYWKTISTNHVLILWEFKWTARTRNVGCCAWQLWCLAHKAVCAKLVINQLKINGKELSNSIQYGALHPAFASAYFQPFTAAVHTLKELVGTLKRDVVSHCHLPGTLMPLMSQNCGHGVTTTIRSIRRRLMTWPVCSKNI